MSKSFIKIVLVLAIIVVIAECEVDRFGKTVRRSRVYNQGGSKKPHLRCEGYESLKGKRCLSEDHRWSLKYSGVKYIEYCRLKCDHRDLWCSHIAYSAKTKECIIYHDDYYCPRVGPIKKPHLKGFVFERKRFMQTNRDWIKIDGICYNTHTTVTTVKKIRTNDECE
jgi:hypothetical protein